MKGYLLEILRKHIEELERNGVVLKLLKGKCGLMRKDKMTERIHEEAGISEDEAATLLNWILELFKATLQKGEPIAIPGFGKCTVRSKAPRPG